VAWTLPPLPDPQLLADRCREAAAETRVQPPLVEKDFHLTRLLGSLGDRFGDQLLLKGGTLLSKVDLGFFRMSEDADLVLPGEPHRDAGRNARRFEPIRTALQELQAPLGCRVRFPGGERFDSNSHILWYLEYRSEFGRQEIKVEVSIRPQLAPARSVRLGQLLHDRSLGDYSGAACHALSQGEARAEKVRAAFTREAIRDFYDLDRLADMGADFVSQGFLALVDAKLVELSAPRFAEQGRSFGLTGPRRARLQESLKRELAAVLRQDAPAFSLDATLERFNVMWGK
jgi:predicted nucleotidyltransferase component of viral defense system